MSFTIVLKFDARAYGCSPAEVNLRGLNLALLDVLKPGRQAPDHERSGQNVDVTADRGIRDAQARAEFEGVEPARSVRNACNHSRWATHLHLL